MIHKDHALACGCRKCNGTMRAIRTAETPELAGMYCPDCGHEWDHSREAMRLTVLEKKRAAEHLRRAYKEVHFALD